MTQLEDGAEAEEPSSMCDLFGGDLTKLPQEDDDGACEYKLKLCNPTPERFTHLVTQLHFRLREGQGECLYEIGVTDDGIVCGLSTEELELSLATLDRMAVEADAETCLVRKRTGCDDPTLTAAEVLVRKRVVDQALLDVRVAVAGNVDSGKSTLIGVLSTGINDNGRGLARASVFKHKHELDNGRTSSISQEIIGFDGSGEIVNNGSAHSARSLDWREITSQSSKLITFIDLAGHERYLKTAVFGMTGHLPDYAMIIVGANMGVTRMTKEHLGIALALRLPVIVVVTKIDICPDEVRQQTMKQINKILKSSAARKFPCVISSESDVLDCSKQLQTSARVVPIFSCSNVNGEGLGLLRSFLNLLPARVHWEEQAAAPTEFFIDETFFVTGVGTVVAGTLMAGTCHANQTLMLGPDGNGKFISTTVKTIQAKRNNVECVYAGQSASFGLKKVKRNQIRKGMVMVDPSLNPEAVWEFEAEVLVLQHPTTITANYQPVIHCITIRQAARIVRLNEHEVLRTGDRANVRFRFMYRPEYLKIGARLVFREGRTKGIGKIRAVFPGTE